MDNPENILKTFMLQSEGREIKDIISDLEELIALSKCAITILQGKGIVAPSWLLSCMKEMHI